MRAQRGRAGSRSSASCARALEQRRADPPLPAVVSLATGEVIGLEALVRWQHPERGLLDPAEFIPVAEDSGLIEPIGRWVAEAACRQTLAWHELRPDAAAVRHLGQPLRPPGRPPRPRRRWSARSLGPDRARPDQPAARDHRERAGRGVGRGDRTLDALSELGVSLVLDDFGTGYSSLAYLNRFPLRRSQDRPLLRRRARRSSRSARAIVEAIIGMARALSLEVIAEGVETEAQLAELRRLGCDFAQGYLFSKPVPAGPMTEAARGGRALRRPARPPLRPSRGSRPGR